MSAEWPAGNLWCRVFLLRRHLVFFPRPGVFSGRHPVVVSHVVAGLSQGLDGGAKLVVPRLPEAAHERLGQKAVERQTQLVAPAHGGGTHAPAVVVKGRQARLEARFAYGIEGARNGFGPGGAALTEALFGRTVAAAVLVVAGKHTVLAVDNGGDEVAVGIGVRHALPGYEPAGGFGEQRLGLGQHLLQLFHLIGQQRGARLAFNTTGSAAGLEVAAETAGKNVGGKQHRAYLQNGGKGLGHIIFYTVMYLMM